MISVVNLKSSKFDIYIGRANRFKKLPKSKWHNPFVENKHGTRSEVITKYKHHLLQSDNLLNALPELHNMRLGCWCKPKDCHGDVLEELEYVSFYFSSTIGRSITPDEFRILYEPFLSGCREVPLCEIIGLIESGTFQEQREQASTN